MPPSFQKISPTIYVGNMIFTLPPNILAERNTPHRQSMFFYFSSSLVSFFLVRGLVESMAFPLAHSLQRKQLSQMSVYVCLRAPYHGPRDGSGGHTLGGSVLE